jgi:hypothetical protein
VDNSGHKSRLNLKVAPGEDEMIALLEGVLPVLRGEEPAQEYRGRIASAIKEED